ncbi:MAG: hypothetical protein Q8Q48_00795 [Candidatus Staskawiczbacteria bacterium]|nr:hypothetical protein [Candidatus Staskawiczbacteria bacterium]
MKSKITKNFFKIKNALKGLPWFLGKNAFWVILFFAFLSVALGAFLYYNYVVMAQNGEPKYNNTAVGFNESIYQRVQNQWQADVSELQKYLNETPENPFASK